MKSKDHYDSLKAECNYNVRVPLELREDFKKLFFRHGDASRLVRDFITNYVVEHQKDN